MSSGPSFNFGDNTNIGTFQTGENAKVVHGDEVQGDKIGNQANVSGDIHGDLNQTQVNGSLVTIAELKEKLAACCDSLSKVFGESGEQGSEPHEFGEDFTPIAIEDDNHPQSLLAATVSMSDQVEEGEEVPAEEVEKLESKWKCMLNKAGKYGSMALKTVGPMAVAGINAFATQPPPPWNIVSAVVKAGIENFNESE